MHRRRRRRRRQRRRAAGGEQHPFARRCRPRTCHVLSPMDSTRRRGSNSCQIFHCGGTTGNAQRQTCDTSRATARRQHGSGHCVCQGPPSGSVSAAGGQREAGSIPPRPTPPSSTPPPPPPTHPHTHPHPTTTTTTTHTHTHLVDLQQAQRLLLGFRVLRQQPPQLLQHIPHGGGALDAQAVLADLLQLAVVVGNLVWRDKRETRGWLCRKQAGRKKKQAGAGTGRAGNMDTKQARGLAPKLPALLAPTLKLSRFSNSGSGRSMTS